MTCGRLGPHASPPCGGCALLLSLSSMLATPLNSLALASRRMTRRRSFHHSFHAASSCSRNQFQVLLTPISGCFSVFLYSTLYAIGLKICLGLPVNVWRFRAPKSGNANLGHSQTSASTSLRGYNPLSPAFTGEFGSNAYVKSKARNTTSHSPSRGRFGLPSAGFVRTTPGIPVGISSSAY